SPPPLTSSLFPYTTLFRSAHALGPLLGRLPVDGERGMPHPQRRVTPPLPVEVGSAHPPAQELVELLAGNACVAGQHRLDHGRLLFDGVVEDVSDFLDDLVSAYLFVHGRRRSPGPVLADLDHVTQGIDPSRESVIHVRSNSAASPADAPRSSEPPTRVGS